MKRAIIGLFLMLFIGFDLAAKVADLQPRDVNIKVSEFLFSHISQKKLTTQIIKRAFDNYVDELDPMKLYLTKEDVESYLELSDEDAQEILSQFHKSNFTKFEELHQKIVAAVNYWSKKEKEIQKDPSTEKVSLKSLEEMKWAENRQELLTRRVQFRNLQRQAAEKLDDDLKEKYLKLSQKNRKWREGLLVGENTEDRQKIVYTTILKSIASALDSQTTYFSPDEAQMFMMQIQQKLQGIGVVLVDDLTGFKIIDILEGGPVEKHGEIKKDDQIVAVNDEIVVGMDMNQAILKIRGPDRTKVKLTLLRYEEGKEEPTKFDAVITRGDIVVDEIRLSANLEPYGDGEIAHLILHSFYQDPKSSCAKDLYNKISELKQKHNLKGVVLDLRGNGGGLLAQAVAVNSLFMKKGIVASVKSHDGSVQHLRNAEPNIIWDGPLVILVDRLSASSAEITTQSLQDYGRAIIVGDEATFGKGTFQIPTMNACKPESLDPKGEYKVTQGMYYTVSGKSPQQVGVKPDIVVPGVLSESKIGEAFSKYPVDNDNIADNFNDTLQDVPFYQREQVKRYYHNNLQPKLDCYNKHLEVLSKNSQARLEKNQDYKNFLSYLKQHKEGDCDEEKIEKTSQVDLQLQEAMNIMKDLLYILETQPREETPAA